MCGDVLRVKTLSIISLIILHSHIFFSVCLYISTFSLHILKPVVIEKFLKVRMDQDACHTGTWAVRHLEYYHLKKDIFQQKEFASFLLG